MAWVATTSFETTDGSTTPTNGNTINATGDGSGWSGNWTNTEPGTRGYRYNNVVAGIPGGSWCAACDTGTNNEEPETQRSLSSSVTSGRVSWYWRFNKTNRDNHVVTIGSGATRAIILQAFAKQTGNRDFVYNNSAGTEVVLASAAFAADTWYKIDIDFDCGTDTFTAYINNVSQGSGLQFRNAVASLDTLRFANGVAAPSGSSAGSIHYVDLIAPAGAHVSTLSETAMVTDSILRTPLRTLSETSTATDTFTSAFVFLQTLTEAVTSVDTLVRSTVKTVTEAVTVADTLLRSGLRTFSETVTGTDTLKKTAGRSLLETASITDTIRKVLNGSATIWSHAARPAAATWSKISKSVSSWTHIDKS